MFHVKQVLEYANTQAGRLALSSLLQTDFSFFVDVFFWLHNKRKFRWNSHHKKIVKALEDVFYGRTTKLVINISPRYGKTELVVKLFSAWCYANNPECNFMHLSYSDQLVMDNSSSIRDTISIPEFEMLFPDSKILTGAQGKGHWKTAGGGSFYAAPAGGGVTGFGAGAMDEKDKDGNFKFSGAILIDDPLKPDDAYSVRMREFVNNRWNSTIKSRRNNPVTTPVIVIMQRIHESDFTAMLLKEGDWTHLTIPALNPDGTALWPQMHTAEALEKMRQSDLYTFSAQYQQEPTPLGGGIFKRAWFRFWEQLPRADAFEKVQVFADTAGETKTVNDYSVFQLWGLREQKAYLIDQVRGKWEAPELLSTATRAIGRWRQEYPKLNKINIEKASVAIGLIQTLQRQVPVPVFPINRTRDKVSRAMTAAPYVQSGMVMFPPERIGFAIDFKKEVESFTATDSHAHDDQCDPMFDMVEEFFVSPAIGGSVTLGGGF